MGDHYVPQYYLKGFSKDEGKTIWVYDKHSSQKFSTQVKSVANITGFYTPGIEKYLSNKVESQANAVLRKIRDYNKITDDDKKVLSEYIVVMMKRVPQSQERVKNRMPSVAKEVSQKFDNILRIAASRQPEKALLIEERRAEIQKYIDKYSKEQLKDIWLDNIPAKMSPRAVTAISNMTWIFLTFDQHLAFLTSDNPVFYFTNMGIGKPESEISFPISSHIALWANWRDDLSEGYRPTNMLTVKELNRRTVSIATRYVFHSDDEAWILPFITKDRWQLNYLQ
jgi:hypothetical protein